MKYIKSFLFLASLVAFTYSASAQKISVDSGKVYVDGVLYASYEKEGCKMFSSNCMYTFRNLQNKPVLVVKQNTTTDPDEVGPSNKKGELFYTDFSFLQSKQKGQIARMSMKDEKVIKILVKAGLFKSGDLDTEAASNFVLVNPVVYPLQQVIIKQKNTDGSGAGNGVNIKF